jgi:hypothetical protein
MLGLGGCASNSAQEPVADPFSRCEAASAQGLLGREASNQLADDALRLTGARTLRWIQPGQAVTMDFREDRLNIALDGMNRAERITCG